MIKSKLKTIINGAVIAASLLSGSAMAATFVADSRTAADPTNTITITRTYQSGFATSDTGTPSPLNSIVWFVADTSNNGINTPNGGTGTGTGTVSTSFFGPGGILGSDDVLLWHDNIDGAKPGSNPGQFQRSNLGGGTYDTSLLTADIYVYVFNITNSVADAGGVGNGVPRTPAPGDKFGVYHVGVVPQPAFGNPLWNIAGNVWADQYTIAAVPEPSTYALVGIGLVGLIARRFKK